MTYIDVFNGDADGICSLVQLRLYHPRQAELVTGVKRDINLLQRVDAGRGDCITVLDISLRKNRDDVERLLAAGADIFYADHHDPGALLSHAHLEAHIDTSATVCTALIIDRVLGGRYRLWAITAAFGDNLEQVAHQLARERGLGEGEIASLQSLGTYLNYNGYGASLDDLFYHPADLYRECVAFASPLDFIRDNAAVYQTLENGFRADTERAVKIAPFHQTGAVTATLLPDETWARRVSGVFGNQLSNDDPARAQLILTRKPDGDYLVSIRAPLNRREGADEVAGQFASGGGRRGAAGINALKEAEIPVLIDLMQRRYG